MEEEKSLQKLSISERLNELEKLYKDKKIEPTEVIDELETHVNISYRNKLGLENVIIDFCLRCLGDLKDFEKIDRIRNSTYTTNHDLISYCIYNEISEYNTTPSVHQIQNQTGLSRTTIHKHLKDGISTELDSYLKNRLNLLVPAALEGLFRIGIRENNPSALKHFIELSGNSPANKTTNNYIQINNLKITKDEFDKLPTTTILEIETIISENLNQSGDEKALKPSTLEKKKQS